MDNRRGSAGYPKLPSYPKVPALHSEQRQPSEHHSDIENFEDAPESSPGPVDDTSSSGIATSNELSPNPGLDAGPTDSEVGDYLDTVRPLTLAVETNRRRSRGKSVHWPHGDLETQGSVTPTPLPRSTSELITTVKPMASSSESVNPSLAAASSANRKGKRRSSVMPTMTDATETPAYGFDWVYGIFDKPPNKGTRFVGTEEEFIALVNDYPKEMLDEHIEMIRVRDQVEPEMESLREKNKFLAGEAAALTESYETMTDSREKYRDLVATLHQQTTTQNLTIQNQQKQIEGFLRKTPEAPNPPQPTQPKRISSDEFLANHQPIGGFQPRVESLINLLRRPKETSKPQLFDWNQEPALSQTGRHRYSELDDPMEARGPTTRWPDIPKFNGDGGPEAWRAWRMKLFTKIQRDSRLFRASGSDIDYARDHCDGDAWNIVASRADPMSLNPYSDIQEMLQDMDISFGSVNSAMETRIKLKDPSSKQRPGEAFASFTARINAIMASTKWSEPDKCISLQELMLPRVRRAVWGVTDTSNYRLYCNACNLIVQNMSHQDLDNNSAKTDRRDSKSRFTYRRSDDSADNRTPIRKKPSGKTKWEKNKWDISRFNKHPAAKKKLIEKGYCSKCLLPGHRPTDPEAPCKDKPAMELEEAVSKLAVIGIKWAPDNDELDDLEEVTDYSQESDSEN